MLEEDVLHFLHTIGMMDTPMFTGDDRFALGTVEMRAPVGHDAVGAHWIGFV